MNAVIVVIAGATLLSVVGIAYGGTFLLRVSSGAHPTNDLQKTFFRAGHAHAGVLVILGLVVALLVDASGANSTWGAVGTVAVLASGILVPLGFFLSVLGRDPARPGRLFASVWIGFASLTAGLVISGISVLAAGIDAL